MNQREHVLSLVISICKHNRCRVSANCTLQ